MGNRCVVPTLKTDVGYEKNTEPQKQADQPKLDLESTSNSGIPPMTLKQELLSLSLKTPIQKQSTAETEPSAKKKTKKIPEHESPQQILPSSFQSEALQLCMSTNKEKYSYINISTQINQPTLHQSVDCQTQTSDIEDECTPADINRSNYIHTQTAIEGARVSNLDVDASEELSFYDSDVVNLASDEDDLEIICSLTTPPRKRKCREKPGCASTSGIDRRTREKITPRRRRNSEGEQNTKVSLLHPRSLLPSFSTSTTAISMTKSITVAKQQTFEQQRSEKRGSSNYQDLDYANKLLDRTCNICKHTFPNLTQARQHVKRVHVTSTPTLSTNQGMFCSNTTPIQGKNVVGNLICQVCFGNFCSTRDLKSHMYATSHREKFKKVSNLFTYV